uniref:Uncharacterized protein n=1 Tax=Cacopsylla melanoneura TaxID=428564 RepID=A0A8D8Q6X4_9HEMI
MNFLMFFCQDVIGGKTDAINVTLYQVITFTKLVRFIINNVSLIIITNEHQRYSCDTLSAKDQLTLTRILYTPSCANENQDEPSYARESSRTILRSMSYC